MMANKFFHVTAEGKAEPCSYNLGTCTKAPAADHFLSLSEAQASLPELVVPAPPQPPRSPFSWGVNKGAIQQFALQGPGSKNCEITLRGMHSGRVNPLNGDGDSTGHWDNSYSLILSEDSGARARVLSNFALKNSNPIADLLGTKVEFLKIMPSSGNLSTTPNLRIVGAINNVKSQEKFGWIPDKRIHFFVEK